MSEHRLVVTTILGLEELLKKEIEKLIPSSQVSVSIGGRIEVVCKNLPSCIKTIVSKSRLAEHVYLQVWRYCGEVSPEQLSSIFEPAINEIKEFMWRGVKFAVKSEHTDDFRVSSLEISKIIGELIEKRYQYLDPVVSLDFPDLVFYVFISSKRAELSIQLTKYRPLHERNYRTYVHPSVLNPIVANALLYLCDCRSILDPFTGSGTIPIEADALDLKVGFDVNIKHVVGAKKNAKAAGSLADFMVADVRFPPLRPSVFDAIVCNPPYGLRERPVGGLRRVYDGLFCLASSVLKRNGIICIVTVRRRLVKQLAEKYGFRITKSIKIYQGGLTSYIFRLCRNLF